MWVINEKYYECEGDPLSVFEVGYYVPGGAITPKWVSLFEYSKLDSAVDMVHYLNGGKK